HGCVGPRPLYRGGDAGAYPPASIAGRRLAEPEERRLPDARRARQDQDPAPAAGDGGEGAVENCRFHGPADQPAGGGRPCRGWGHKRVPHLVRLPAGRDAELGPERPVEPFELPQGGVAVAAPGMAAHELDVGPLVARIELDDLLPALEE